MRTVLQDLKDRIDSLDQRITEARKAEQWDFVNQLIDCCESLEAEYDALNSKIQREKSTKELDDWYDDEQHRDAYNERIVSLYL
jgi:hypothetical protein